MKKSVLFFVLLLACLGAFCKSKKKTEEKSEKPASPVWMTDEGRLSVFPSSQYLSAFAFGGNPEAAKNKAAETLSEFIKSQVTSSVNYTVSNDDYSVFQDSTVETDNLMFCTEYTNPFYSEYHGMYCVVGYIDRTKAFNYVKPKLESAARNFPSAYERSLLIEDNFEKISSINRARKCLAEFYEVYDFARAVNPQKCAVYEKIDVLSKQSDETLAELKPKVVINVQVKGDFDGRVKTALSGLFSQAGFTVSESEKEGCYRCAVNVDFGSAVKTSNTVELYPSYSLEITKSGNEESVNGENGGKRTVFSVSRKLNKAAGFDAATAERRAKLAVENDIKNIQI